MKLTRRRTILLVLLGLVLLGGGLASRSSKLSWRLRLVRMQLNGDLPGVTWSDLLRAAGPTGSSADPEVSLLRSLATDRYSSIVNPFGTEEDIEEGGAVFATQCAACHGLDGSGSPRGPALTIGNLKRGGSDWAVFQTISQGVPGTLMEGTDLPAEDVWKLVAFVKRLALDSVLVEDAADSVEPRSFEPVAYEALLAAGGQPTEWLMYSGQYHGRRFSNLSQVDRSNVARLRPLWVYQMGTPEARVLSSPVVVNGLMLVTEPPSNVIALDARTGEEVWRYERSMPDRLPLLYGRINRGVAVLGESVFVGTLDAHLVSLDAATGQVRWETEVADSQRGHTITGAPLAVKDMVLIGVAGGMHGIRGFLDAYDAATGERRWRFWTIPGPGEPGHDTWAGESWKTGGAPTWLTGSFDPELNLIYWGVGNPSPAFAGYLREGDNVHANSVIALDADSGELDWAFQFTPHDTHDWDASQIPVLVDRPWGDRTRKLLLTANRNGFFYVLDRETGEFLQATPFGEQTWADSIMSSGRPATRPESEPTEQGTLVYPGFLGATNWWSPAYSQLTGLFYVHTWHAANVYYSSPDSYSPGRKYVGGSALPYRGSKTTAAVRAISPAEGSIVWEHELPGESAGGLLSTAGQLVFVAHGPRFKALDAETGEQLWSYMAGGYANAAPITYEIDGRQVVAVAMGRSVFVFGL